MRAVDTAGERLASLACLFLECALRAVVRLRRMFLSLAFVLASTPESIMHAAFQSTAGEFFNAWGQVVVEMPYESQMTRPANDTSSHFDSIGSQPAQRGPTLRRRAEIAHWFHNVSDRRHKRARAAFAVE
jgi:hypothetical protein